MSRKLFLLPSCVALRLGGDLVVISGSWEGTGEPMDAEGEPPQDLAGETGRRVGAAGVDDQGGLVAEDAGRPVAAGEEPPRVLLGEAAAAAAVWSAVAREEPPPVLLSRRIFGKKSNYDCNGEIRIAACMHACILVQVS